MDLTELRRNCQARLSELDTERNAILKFLNSTTGETPRRKRRKLSAAARKAISDAQKKRWASVKAKGK